MHGQRAAAARRDPHLQSGHRLVAPAALVSSGQLRACEQPRSIIALRSGRHVPAHSSDPLGRSLPPCVLLSVSIPSARSKVGVSC